MAGSKDLGCVNGLMVKSMKVSGKTIRNMVTVYIPGLMVENMKEIIAMIRNTVREHIHGLTRDST